MIWAIFHIIDASLCRTELQAQLSGINKCKLIFRWLMTLSESLQWVLTEVFSTKNDHNQLLQIDYKHQNWSKEVFHMTVMMVLSTGSKCCRKKNDRRLIFSITVEKLVICYISSEYAQLKETFHHNVLQHKETNKPLLLSVCSSGC